MGSGISVPHIGGTSPVVTKTEANSNLQHLLKRLNKQDDMLAHLLTEVTGARADATGAVALATTAAQGTLAAQETLQALVEEMNKRDEKDRANLTELGGEDLVIRNLKFLNLIIMERDYRRKLLIQVAAVSGVVSSLVGACVLLLHLGGVL